MNSFLKVVTIRCLIAVVFVVGVSGRGALAQQQLCPGCYKDQQPFPGRYGPASATDPRRLVKIKIASSWNVDQAGNATPSQTNPTIFNAFNDQNSGSGPALWNNARDGSATTSVFFQLDQVADPDIIVKLGPVANGGCAQTDIAKKPMVLTLPLRAASWTPAQIALIVAHELGHTIGLAHAVNGPGETLAPDCPPPGVNSVMKGAPYSTCQPVFSRIEATDVRAHNIQFQSRLTMCRVARAGGYAPTPDDPGDPGGDPCPGCNPQPPVCSTNSTIYISSDGLGCYHVVYQEETYCDGLFVSSNTYAWDVCTTGYPL
jgi:hypothetical protein